MTVQRRVGVYSRWLAVWRRVDGMPPRRRVSWRRRSGGLWVLAAAAGVMAAWLVQRHLAEREAWLADRHRQPLAQRVVMAHDLPAGTLLDAAHLAVRDVPVALASSDSVAPSEYSRLLGARLRQSLKAGDLLLPAHLDKEAPGAFSDSLSAGRRAVTLPLDVLNLTAGLLRPGDRIDLFVSFDHQHRRVTAPLMQSVRILATGTQAQRQSSSWTGAETGSYATVTLDASPDEAVKLVAARHSGTLTAVLRAPDDDGETRRAMRGDLAVLLGMAETPAPQAAPGVQVWYGDAGRPGVERRPSMALVPSPAGGWFELPGEREER